LVNLPDPQGRNPKNRPVVIITPTEEISVDDVIVAVAITGRIEKPLPKICVRLPWHRGGHPRTGLSKPSVARCDWLVAIRAENVIEKLGVVPPKQLQQIIDTVDNLP
jgi:mRNA-degrading endonuclease toxin of MazEF toxin-antitoxin module